MSAAEMRRSHGMIAGPFELGVDVENWGLSACVNFRMNVAFVQIGPAYFEFSWRRA